MLVLLWYIIVPYINIAYWAVQNVSVVKGKKFTNLLVIGTYIANMYFYVEINGRSSLSI